jgi:hypothetical protein
MSRAWPRFRGAHLQHTVNQAVGSLAKRTAISSPGTRTTASQLDSCLVEPFRRRGPVSSRVRKLVAGREAVDTVRRIIRGWAGSQNRNRMESQSAELPTITRLSAHAGSPSAHLHRFSMLRPQRPDVTSTKRNVAGSRRGAATDSSRGLTKSGVRDAWRRRCQELSSVERRRHNHRVRHLTPDTPL